VAVDEMFGTSHDGKHGGCGKRLLKKAGIDCIRKECTPDASGVSFLATSQSKYQIKGSRVQSGAASFIPK